MSSALPRFKSFGLRHSLRRSFSSAWHQLHPSLSASCEFCRRRSINQWWGWRGLMGMFWPIRVCLAGGVPA